jgi:hypothetical protein
VEGFRLFPKCAVRSCSEYATQEHYVLYEHHPGGPATFGLCVEHHRWITRAQCRAARLQRHALSVNQRWWFWSRLIEGELKRPR